MRNKLFDLVAVATMAALVPGCMWTEFDDLKDDTWVNSKGKPSVDSANWAVAIQRGQMSGAGGRLVVMGASQAVYSELVVSSGGDVSLAPTQLELNSQFGIGNLDAQPLLLADPTSNDTALVTSSGSASIAVLRGASGNLVVHQVFGPATVDAATYMIPPAPAAQISQTLVAEGDTVFGTFFMNPPNPQPSCKLTDGTNPVMVSALGATPRGDGTHDVIVWGSTGKLLKYPPDVFNGALGIAGCATGVGPSATAATPTELAPGKGSQILTFETSDAGTITGRFAVLQGHDTTGKGLVALYDLGAMTMIGSARTENGVKSASLMELAGKRYVVIGYPDAIIDGTSGAGQVLVFEVDNTNGIGSTAALTLHDAQPESNQAFGRSVTVMPFDGDPLIVVAADNEVFTYFRTNLYGETRE